MKHALRALGNELPLFFTIVQPRQGRPILIPILRSDKVTVCNHGSYVG